MIRMMHDGIYYDYDDDDDDVLIFFPFPHFLKAACTPFT